MSKTVSKTVISDTLIDDFAISRFIEKFGKFGFVVLRVLRVLAVPVSNRHGQSRDPCQRANPGVYKTVVLTRVYGKTVIYCQFATAIWDVHFGTGKPLF